MKRLKKLFHRLRLYIPQLQLFHLNHQKLRYHRLSIEVQKYHQEYYKEHLHLQLHIQYFQEEYNRLLHQMKKHMMNHNNQILNIHPLLQLIHMYCHNH